MAESSEEKQRSTDLQKFFSGKKEKWFPLFRRLMARLTRVGGVEIAAVRATLALTSAGVKGPVIGRISVTPGGLKVALALRAEALKSDRLKPTRTKSRLFSHEVVISGPGEIDEEFIAWIKAANRRARSAKRRST